MKVQPWCDSPEFFCEFEEFYIKGGKESVSVLSARVQKNMVILKIDGVDTPEDAVKLRNSVLYIDRNDVELEDGCYFIQDLIGLSVVDAENATVYGIITDVTETGANDVYHIKADDGKMYYIPAIPDVVVETDLDNGKMLIKPLKGLFDDED